MGETLRRALILVQAVLILVLASSRLKADTGTCGGVTTTVPFNALELFQFYLFQSHLRELVDRSSPAYYLPGTDNSPNPTCGSSWIVQVQPTMNSPVKSEMSLPVRTSRSEFSL